jgi:hypothetical protein
MKKRMHAEIVENGRPPGALRHKMTGGIESRRILRGEEDRDGRLDTLESLLPVTQQPRYDRFSFLNAHSFLGADGPPPGNDCAVNRGQKVTRENYRNLMNSAS